MTFLCGIPAELRTCSYMFYDARSFDQPLGLWEVAQVIDMHEMFFTASTFNQDISLWDISWGTRINKIFEGAFAFISSFPGKHSSTWLHFPRGNNARSNFRTVESVPVVYFGVCLRKVQRENDISKLINSFNFNYFWQEINVAGDVKSFY